MGSTSSAPISETTVARNEVVLMNLRQEPINLLLQQGIESTFTSKAHKNGESLTVDTSRQGSKAKSAMRIDGQADTQGWDLSAMFSDTVASANLKVTHFDGGSPRVEQDQFKMSGNPSDFWWNRPDKLNLSMTRVDEHGKQIQYYEPAISEPQKQLDPNGQPIRIARPAGSDANCFRENPGNPGNHRLEADFIIHDPKLGDIGYNTTRELNPAGWAYRSVVRDMKGNVLGIVYQDFKVDGHGDITDVTTSARKPRQPK